MIPRSLETIIVENLNKGKIIHVPGPRQVGKTTLLKKIAEDYGQPVLWLNGDEADVKELFTDITSTRLAAIIGKYKLIFIDEAQRIRNIGIALKLLADNFKNIKVIATGSSAFELSDLINEPLTGRKIELFLFPLSFQEMVNYTSLLEEKRMLRHRLIYGYYPEVINTQGEEKETLQRLTDAYLYKDILSYEKIKRTSLIEKLLQALAFQIGNQLSYNEIGQTIGADNQTVEKYIGLLEKAYIVFTLTSLSRNLRNELKKSKKVYFYDNGIRNAIIRNFNPAELRQDTGALWENFLIAERFKVVNYKRMWINRYFWRTVAQQEIDYIEEYDGKLHAYEFKWKADKKHRLPLTYSRAYPDSAQMTITRENFDEFIRY